MMSYILTGIVALGIVLIASAPARSRRAWVTLATLLAAIAISTLCWGHASEGIAAFVALFMLGGFAVFTQPPTHAECNGPNPQ